MSQKVCAVVGAGPGLGAAVARRFAREGFSVALLARNSERLEAQTQSLKDEGVEARGYPADASKPEELRQALRQVADELGAPTVLVYNAAAFKPSLPSTLPVQRLVEEFKVNVAGALASAQSVLAAMTEAGEGTLLFTGGGLALDPWPEMASLAVGKAGIRNLTYSLGKELKDKGIHVATVTIKGLIKEGTEFDPDRIADAYFELHEQAPDAWETERVFG